MSARIVFLVKVLILLFSCFHLPVMAGGNFFQKTSGIPAASTKQIRPTDDTYVYGRGGAEAGIIRGLDDMTFLKSYYNGNRAWAFETYLKFDLSSLSSDPAMIERVVLKLFGSDDNGNQHTLNLFDMSGTVWDEDNLNYTTIAATGNKSLITSITVDMTTEKWYEWDITNYIKTKVSSGTQVICLMVCDNVTLKKANGTTNVIASFQSKEHPGGNAPMLEVTENSYAELLLSELRIDGQLISGFQPTVYGYTVKLSAKQTQLPVVTALAANSSAQVAIQPATSLTGTLAERTTSVVVSGANQTLAYKVVFEKNAVNNSTKLTKIYVDDQLVDFFDKEKRTYAHSLPYTQNPQQSPIITFDAENPDQTISILPAASLTGSAAERTARVRVTSSDETATADYELVFKILPEMDLFLCIGQSNMAGRGYINEAAGDMNPLPKTYLFTPGFNWEVASNPMNKYSSIRKELSMQRISPAYGFALNMQGKTTNPIGLIVNAQGGSSMAQWTKGSIDGLYEKSLLRAKEAQKWGKIKAILWHQGESNSSSSAAAAYPNQLKAMVDNFKADLNEPNLPVVAGELAYWRGGGTGSNAFNTMIRTISNFLPYSDYISAEGLTPLIDATDPHFDRASNIELGKRYAEKVVNLVYSPTSVLVTEDTKAPARIRTDKKKVIVDEITNESNLKIYDVTGKLMINSGLSAGEVRELTLQEGIYGFVFSGPNGTYRQKVMVH